MSPHLTGFVVRVARVEQKSQILRLFDSALVSPSERIVYGAFGKPGDFPLGGVILRPVGTDASDLSANFQIVVRPEFRRKGVGTRLLQTVIADARRGGMRSLCFSSFVHQDDPYNHFYRRLGMVADRTYITYRVSIPNKVLPVSSRIVQRFRKTNAALAVGRVVAIELIEPVEIARFFATHYGGQVDHRLEQLRSGFYDKSISTAILNPTGEVLAANLYRSQPGNSAIYLDLVLVHPAYRDGPLPLALFEATAWLSLKRGFKDCVFEADPHHDPFATGFARRCGCQPQGTRCRYSIQLSP